MVQTVQRICRSWSFPFVLAMSTARGLSGGKSLSQRARKELLDVCGLQCLLTSSHRFVGCQLPVWQQELQPQLIWCRPRWSRFPFVTGRESLCHGVNQFTCFPIRVLVWFRHLLELWQCLSISLVPSQVARNCAHSSFSLPPQAPFSTDHTSAAFVPLVWALSIPCCLLCHDLVICTIFRPKPS